MPVEPAIIGNWGMLGQAQVCLRMLSMSSGVCAIVREWEKAKTTQPR